MIVSTGMFSTLMIAVGAIFVGEYLRLKFNVLKRYCLPSAVVGGILFAGLTTILHISEMVVFEFDYTTLNQFFYNVFFAASGLSASLLFLKKSSKLIFIFTLLAALLAIFQNILALEVGFFMGINPLIALMAGSIPLTGGHGNAASFAPIAVSMGADAALEVAIASATFGLVAGCIMAGPIGRRLILKHRLNNCEYIQTEEQTNMSKKIQHFVSQKRAHNAVFILLLACGIGELLYYAFRLAFPSLNLPLHVMSMFGGILMRLFLDYKKSQSEDKEALYESISIVGSVCLALFVSLSIITMKLWELVSLAVPLLTILCLQLVLIYFFVVYVTFRLCGKNYDAAIISVGHCGFGLGAVPVSMATMSSVCSEFRYSPLAFFVVPLIGGFISNITNALIITIFLNVAST
ncbi:sodium/glutamate symporter [Campylobacter sp. MIT 21-1685]|uniref:sodium/glutamate symporter n=1 Tax=unclassified Campylobacter TaxID=2593542 RepID=UPI00224B44A3|nr:MULTISPECIES: sodium/glutamate symporter [unclassified Campylobacter]MCX2682616.1 sodium/glutamate symporter [Campylobacter sp. MIT 21-1684]MCX2750896.1 sodium/glutamate symporter [Campylobacter sp. MIT 21-1682]MCX2807171.1 sodium/glutamate symporter [Campylobacter sp. MIT 21-1685]